MSDTGAKDDATDTPPAAPSPPPPAASAPAAAGYPWPPGYPPPGYGQPPPAAPAGPSRLHDDDVAKIGDYMINKLRELGAEVGDGDDDGDEGDEGDDGSDASGVHGSGQDAPGRRDQDPDPRATHPYFRKWGGR